MKNNGYFKTRVLRSDKELILEVFLPSFYG